MKYSVLDIKTILFECNNKEDLNECINLINEELEDNNNQYSSFEKTIINKLIKDKTNELS